MVNALIIRLEGYITSNPAFLGLLYAAVSLFWFTVLLMFVYFGFVIKYFLHFKKAEVYGTEYSWNNRGVFPKWLNPAIFISVLAVLFLTSFALHFFGIFGTKVVGNIKKSPFVNVNFSYKMTFKFMTDVFFNVEKGIYVDQIAYSALIFIILAFATWVLYLRKHVRMATSREINDFREFENLVRERKKLIASAMESIKGIQFTLTEELHDLLKKAVYKSGEAGKIKNNVSIPFLLQNYPNTILLNRDLSKVVYHKNFGLCLSGNVVGDAYVTSNYSEYESTEVMYFLYFKNIGTIQYKYEKPGEFKYWKRGVQKPTVTNKLTDIIEKEEGFFDPRSVHVIERPLRMKNAPDGVQELSQKVIGDRITIIQGQQRYEEFVNNEIRPRETKFSFNDTSKIHGFAAARLLTVLNIPKDKGIMRLLEENTSKLIDIYRSSFFNFTVSTAEFKEKYEAIEKTFVYEHEIE